VTLNLLELIQNLASTIIGTVKSTRKNSSREQIVETTAGEGTESFLTHHATGKGDRSQANKEEAQEQIPPAAHRLRARTKPTNPRAAN
jgi:hypothetical protein